MKPQVSILIAVHNAAEYINECLDSLQCQTLSQWEAICIDDASTDGSYNLLLKRAALDSRIVVYRNSSNCGASISRNRALSHAQGEYVMMLDSDDRLSPDALERASLVLNENAETDIVIFRLMYWNSWTSGSDHEYSMTNVPAVMTGYEAFHLCLRWRLHGLYLTRISLHREYPFDESAPLYSDDNTSRIHYLHARKVQTCDGIYYYRQHSTSSTHNVSVNRFYFLVANRSLKLKLEEERVGEDDLNVLEEHRWLNWLSHCRLYIKEKEKFSINEKNQIEHILSETLHSMEFDRLRMRVKLRVGNWCLRGLRSQILQQRAYLLLQKTWRCMKSLF